MDPFSIGLIVVILVVALIALFSSLRIAAEYERGVVFRLGRLIPLKGPGLFFIIPFGVDRLVKIDLRTITLEVPPQEIITNDNVTAKVNAVIYFQVIDARKAVTQVLNYINATSQISQTTLRAALGQSTLDELLANREKINQNLQRIIDEQTEPWGIKVAVVEIKDVELPSTMQRAMAKQAEAEREKRAKIINADGEFQASQTLANAAQVISSQQGALELTVMVTGLAAAAIAAQPVRRQVARLLPIDADNPVHALALALTVILLGIDVAVIAFTDVLATAQAQPPLTIADLFFDETPFLVFALIGVGLFIRRELPDTAARLGLVLPRWWQIAVALASAGAFYFFVQQVDVASHRWTPDLAHRVDAPTNHIFGQLGWPAGTLAVAVIPGLCEELLF